MGKLIVIDGLDGSGKATQTELTYKWLSKIFNRTRKLEFPVYTEKSSTLIKMYLNGEINDNPSEINPYAASSFYSSDRYINYKLNWEKDYNEGCVFIADRYISANIIHQGAKIKSREDREKYYRWAYEYETKLVGIPRENMTIILLMRPENSQKLMRSRSKTDIHEKDIEYLHKCYNVSKEASIVLGWKVIECDDDKGNIKSVNDIQNEIKSLIREELTIERQLSYNH